MGTDNENFGSFSTVFPYQKQGAHWEMEQMGIEQAPIWVLKHVKWGFQPLGYHARCFAFFPFFFFLRFIYFYCKVRYIQRRGETERNIVHSMIHSPSDHNSWCCADQKTRTRIPRPWAILECFPRPQAGIWMGSRAARIRMSTTCDPGTFKVRISATGNFARHLVFFFLFFSFLF